MHWSSIKEQAAGFFRLELMLLIYKILGRFWVQILLYPIVFFTIISNKKLRNSSKEYLQQIYLIKKFDKSFKPSFWNIFKHNLYFADSLVDRVESWFGNIKVDNLNIKTTDSFNEIKYLIENKKGVFLIGSHLGNMELLRGLSIVNKDLKINAIIQTNHTKHFTNLIKKINKNSAVNIISATQINASHAISLSDKLQQGEIISIKADRTAQNNQEKKLELNFLEKKAEFPLGPFLMANIMQAPTYLIFCLKDKKRKNSYDIYFFKSPLDPSLKRSQRNQNIELSIKDYASNLEKLCLKYPYQWFNFFDFFKTKS